MENKLKELQRLIHNWCFANTDDLKIREIIMTPEYFEVKLTLNNTIGDTVTYRFSNDELDRLAWWEKK